MSIQREEHFRICTWDVDQADRLTMSAAFNYCQEAAGNHARELGNGTEKLRALGLAWVLSRMSLVLDERPGWGVQIAARTWPRGRDRLFAIRDYQLLAKEGRVIGRGRSAWLVLDLTSFKPRRLESLSFTIPENHEMDGLVDGVKSIESRKDMGPSIARLAAYSDMDYNGHVNNARYVQWIQDVLPVEALLKAESLRLDINYLAEVKPGEKACIAFVQTENGRNPSFHVEGTHESTGKPCLRAVLSVPSR
ncbi:MAG: acyl-ACP thioesterase domain-containing protein [Spirochaetia bacterium]|jgi:acyl-ACP thioesterase